MSDHHDSSQSSPAPIGTTIQTQADLLVSLIESERADAAVAANERLQKYQLLFNAFRQQSLVVHAAEQAHVADTQKKLLEMQHRFSQHAQNPSSTSAPQSSAASQIAAMRHAMNGMNQQHAPAGGQSLEKQRLEHLQTVLNPFGIIISAENTLPSLRFEAGWDAVLADLGVSGQESFVVKLTNRLQHDRQTIADLGDKLCAAEKERTRLMKEHETNMTSLMSELSRLREATASSHSHTPPKIPRSAPPIFQMPPKVITNETSYINHNSFSNGVLQRIDNHQPMFS